MRTKEDAHDYRYFPDPDLPPLVVPDALHEAERAGLSELPHVREARFVAALGLSAYDAEVLTQNRARADYFEACAGAVDAKIAANWIIDDLLGALAKDGIELTASPVTPTALAALLGHLQRATLSSRMAKDALAAMLAGADGEAWVREHGGQVSDTGALVAAIDPILDANPGQVAELLSGKDKVFGFFVGQAMRAVKGKADPEQVQRVLRERLEAGANEPPSASRRRLPRWEARRRDAASLHILDQRLLPVEEVALECTSAEAVSLAIRDMAMRGAPAIGVSAAYGVVLGPHRRPVASFAQSSSAPSRRTWRRPDRRR